MKKTLLLVVMLVAATAMSAQSDSTSVNHSDSASTLSRAPTAGRKKVGVVLSGGGAKGTAHIGALKVIERAGIPIDIVTGTSMGSIVGGLYAIGYNASLLDSVVSKQDWTHLITDKEDTQEQDLNERRKSYTYALSMGLTLNKRKPATGGIIKGRNIYNLFYKLCEGYTDSLDFSRDLPIPFACVATNIVDYSEVVFHKGVLPRAMRASMAIPAVFAPVREGSMVLVDGGLRNNYPADLARQMGADVIIGVSVQEDPKPAEQLSSTMTILGQIIDINCKNKYEENMAITDVPIRVNVTGYSSASFSSAAIDTLIRRGEEAAMGHWDELLALKKRIGIDSSYTAPVLTPRNPDVLVERKRVVDYVMRNMTAYDERFLRQKFNLKEGDSIDVQREQQLTTSMRMDLFYQTADCHTRPNGDGVTVVLTAGNRKTTQASAGFRFDNEEYAAVQLEADFPIAKAVPVDADFTVRLGKRIMARGDITISARYFNQPKLSYAFRRNDIDGYTKGNRDYSMLYYQHQTELTPVNVNIKNFNLTMGARWDYMHYRDKLVASSTEQIALNDENYFSYRAKLSFISEDNWIFPTKGSRFNAVYAYITDNFATLDGKPGLSDISANWRTTISFNSRFTLQPMAYARLIFGYNPPLVFSNVVGGQWFGHYVEQQMPFAGIGDMENVDDHFVALQLQAQQRIGSNHYVQLTMGGAQQANNLGDLLKSKTVLGWQAAYSYNFSMIGPAGIALGYSTRTRSTYFYANLGFEF